MVETEQTPVTAAAAVRQRRAQRMPAELPQTEALASKRVMPRDNVKPAQSALMHENERAAREIQELKDLQRAQQMSEPQRKWITPATAQGASSRLARATGKAAVGKFDGTQVSSPIVSPSQQNTIGSRTFKKNVIAAAAGKTAHNQ